MESQEKLYESEKYSQSYDMKPQDNPTQLGFMESIKSPKISHEKWTNLFLESFEHQDFTLEKSKQSIEQDEQDEQDLDITKHLQWQDKQTEKKSDDEQKKKRCTGNKKSRIQIFIQILTGYYPSKNYKQKLEQILRKMKNNKQIKSITEKQNFFQQEIKQYNPVISKSERIKLKEESYKPGQVQFFQLLFQMSVRQYYGKLYYLDLKWEEKNKNQTQKSQMKKKIQVGLFNQVYKKCIQQFCGNQGLVGEKREKSPVQKNYPSSREQTGGKQEKKHLSKTKDLSSIDVKFKKQILELIQRHRFNPFKNKPTTENKEPNNHKKPKNKTVTQRKIINKRKKAIKKGNRSNKSKTIKKSQGIMKNQKPKNYETKKQTQKKYFF